MKRLITGAAAALLVAIPSLGQEAGRYALNPATGAVERMASDMPQPPRAPRYGEFWSCTRTDSGDWTDCDFSYDVTVPPAQTSYGYRPRVVQPSYVYRERRERNGLGTLATVALVTGAYFIGEAQ